MTLTPTLFNNHNLHLSLQNTTMLDRDIFVLQASDDFVNNNTSGPEKQYTVCIVLFRGQIYSIL